jgi:hypothetical protein
VLDYGLSNANFEPPNHAFTHIFSYILNLELGANMVFEANWKAV